jgi:uncharacterized protein (DUF2336 family)
MAASGVQFARLIELAKEESSDKRRELLREITDMFFDSADTRTSKENQLFDEVLRAVAREMEEAVLADLSTRFADAADAPKELVRDLAGKAFRVAEPLLRNSPVLRDEDLLRLVSEQSQEHIRAIAQRDTVSPALTHAIVKVGNDDAIDTLLRNAGATFERATIERVVDRAMETPKMHEGVVTRQDLPIDLLNEMFFVVEKKLRTVIVERNSRVDPKELDDALARARSRIEERNRKTANTGEMLQAAKLIDQKKRNGDLTPNLLVSLFRDKQMPAFIYGLGELTGLDYETCKSIVARKDMDALATICRAAEIERPLFVTLAMLLAGGPSAMTHAESFGQLYNSVPIRAAQRAMRFYRVRKSAGPNAAA